MGPRAESSMALGTSIEGFVRALRRADRSESTVRSYRWALDDLAAWLGPERDVASITGQDLEAWQDHLLEGPRRLQARSRGLAATAVRSWLRWATEHDLVDWRVARAVQTVRRRKGRPDPIPLSDLERIKAHLATFRPDAGLRPLRDRALFYLLLTSGFRIAEALQLRRHDWQRAVVRQKGGEPKALVVPPSVVTMVGEYLAARHDQLTWLWVTTGHPALQLGHESTSRIWKAMAKRVGVPPWTNHQLRHTCGTEMARAGLPIQVIADHLGHEGLATVLNYVAIVEEQAQMKLEVLERLTTTPAGRGWVKIRGRKDRRKL